MTGVTADPETDRTVRLEDGRSLAFSEWGDLEGDPVFLFHGRPGSRLLCPDEESTLAAGARLITVDRPGYGRSDPRPGRTLLDWGDDMGELADQLELDRFPIIGWSSGGPHALACAVRMPTRVTRIGLAATAGPCDAVPGAWEELPDEVRALTELLRRDPPAALDGITKRLQWYAEDPESVLAPGFAGWAGPQDPDDMLLARTEILEPMQRWMREGARQGSTGFVEDWIAEQLPWGFDLSGIEHPVHIWWGEQDSLVSRTHTDYLASTLPRSTRVLYPGDGHLFPVAHWREMLSSLL
jgi:pimeloyl-ACP methyl ester carboxylesterase